MAFIVELFRTANSHKLAFPEQAASESQAKARSIESTIYKDALSKEDYLERCNDKIAAFNRSAPPLNQGEPTDRSQPDPPPQEAGETIGPYTNCTHHATGLFSTIYKTHLTHPTPHTLALKLTTPSQSLPPHDPHREARLLRLAAHPNIVELLSTHTLPSHFLLTFPFQPLTLESLLDRAHHNPLHPTQSKRIIHDLFSALTHIHSLSLIHRDIKPSNILLASATGPAYLADFGIAWYPHDPASEAADQKITDVGTTCYRPPELLFGQKAYNHTIDLWAAGCVVAEIVYYTTTTTKNKHEKAYTLFTSGALGSDLALVKSIFETLGTPTEETWPEAKDLPDWGKMKFMEFPGKRWEDILPGVEERARELVGGLVRYQSTERWSAERVVRWDVWGEGSGSDG